ncbi:MAG: choice-of-anchor J domain-containing protein [Bacteroidales bacterium]
MKRLSILFILAFAFEATFCQLTVTIGNGTATQKQPFGMWASYERSASLYLASEIGSFGTYGMMINTLGWNAGTGEQTMCPIRIYLKTTTASTLSTTTWGALTTGATLVFDAALNFPVAGWYTIDIADFAYTSGNLLVLCETNFGGSGATFYPVFKYSYFPVKHQFWQEYDSPPIGNGTVNDNRPNIQITSTFLAGSVVPPSGFMAKAVSSSQVNLNWRKNAAADAVIVAYSTENTFGTPAGSYLPGDIISGGGTVIYSGSGTTFSQETDLIPGTTYYYKAWSVHSPGPVYSISTTSSAMTMCDATNIFPSVTDFEMTIFPPSCWSMSGLPWTRSAISSGYGQGTGSAIADFFHTSSGAFEIVTPSLDFGPLSSLMVSFDHAYATYGTQVDKLEILTSSDNGISFILLNTWLGGIDGPLNTAGAITTPFIPIAGQWATKTQPLPAGTNKVMFRGTSGYGNNLYLDNITFYGVCPAPISLSSSNITSSGAELGWVAAGLADLWQIKWGVAGFDTLTGGTLIPDVGANPYILEGLVPGQSYEFYVRTDCGSSYSPWVGPLLFSTVCMAVDVPYLENFDNFSPPGTGCMEVTDNNGDAIQWITSALSPASLPNSIYLSPNSSSSMDDWFFSPGINLSEGVAYTLNFHYRGDGAGVSEKLEVKWGTGSNAAEMIAGQVWSNENIQTSEYLVGTILLIPDFTGAWYFGWHGYSQPGSGYLAVDDISVYESEVSWNGAVSGSWEEPANWTPPGVPIKFQNVTIPSGTPNNPEVYSTGLECRDLTIDPDASLTIYPDGEVQVNGELTLRNAPLFMIHGIRHLPEGSPK